MDIEQFEERKREHLQHALNPSNQTFQLSGLDQVHLTHEALPEFDFSEILLQTPCLGKPSLTPFFIAGMTAGHPDSDVINRSLASACNARKWPMGVGSQRRELREEAAGGLLPDRWQELRRDFPDLVLFANLGLSQAIGVSIGTIQRLVDSIRAEALVIHCNALQEIIQPEGTPQFRGGLAAIRRICENLKIPVVLKETGCGFSAGTLMKLRDVGLAAVDTSGLGGTHWGRIEGARAPEQSQRAIASRIFSDWGEPTVQVVCACKTVFSSEPMSKPVEIWASGGVRSGLDAAKLIALGAHRVGYAQPALEAALKGQEHLERWMEQQEFELKVALFCTGCISTTELREKEGVWRKSFG